MLPPFLLCLETGGSLELNRTADFHLRFLHLSGHWQAFCLIRPYGSEDISPLAAYFISNFVLKQNLSQPRLSLNLVCS